MTACIYLIVAEFGVPSIITTGLFSLWIYSSSSFGMPRSLCLRLKLRLGFRTATSTASLRPKLSMQDASPQLRLLEESSCESQGRACTPFYPADGRLVSDARSPASSSANVGNGTCPRAEATSTTLHINGRDVVGVLRATAALHK